MTIQCYSYIRFSTQRQADGDSLRRQIELARKYCDERGYILDDSVTMHDLGISAYDGKNLEEGALVAFLTGVDEGKIPSDAFLLVESLDRISRLPVLDALSNFQSIIARGITIVTLTDGMSYSKASLAQNWTQLIIALATMSRSHEESRQKSRRIGARWAEKKRLAREQLEPIGDIAPLWLRFDNTGYSIHEERAQIVRQIFQWSAEGLGVTRIVKRLSDNHTPSFKGKEWATSSVKRLLCNRAVLGEYQPKVGSGAKKLPQGEPIPGYYPPVIDEDLFYQVQGKRETRRVSKATKQTADFQVWQGIAKCGLCGAALHKIDKGRPPKGAKYLICYRARKGLCDAKHVRFEKAEAVFAELLVKIDAVSLVQQNRVLAQSRLAQIDGRIAELKQRLSALERALEGAISTVITKKIIECESEIRALTADRERLVIELSTDRVIDKDEFFAKLDLTSQQVRSDANDFVKRLGVSVEVTPDPLKFVAVKDGNALTSFEFDWAGRIRATPLSADQYQRMIMQDSPSLSSIAKVSKSIIKDYVDS